MYAMMSRINAKPFFGVIGIGLFAITVASLIKKFAFKNNKAYKPNKYSYSNDPLILTQLNILQKHIRLNKNQFKDMPKLL